MIAFGLVVFSVSRSEAAAPLPDTFERAERRDRAVRPEVRERDGREQDGGESETGGEQEQDVDEQELHGVPDDRSERAKPPVAQDMISAVSPLASRN